MSVKVYIFYEGFDHENILIFPVASENFITLHWTQYPNPAFLVTVISIKFD